MQDLFEQGDDECSHVLNIYNNKQKKESENGNLYLSSVFILGCKNYLKAKKINCVLTVIDRNSYNAYKIKSSIVQAGIQHHKWIQLQDEEKADIYPHLNEAHHYIKEMLQKNNVVVHCHVGVSRSSSLVLAYLIKQYNWNYEQALDFLQDKRNIVDPNNGFVIALKKFEMNVHSNGPEKTITREQLC